MLIIVISFWKASICKLRRTSENVRGPSFSHFSVSGSEHFSHSGLIYVCLYDRFITEYCVNFVLKSAQKYTIYKKKKKGTQDLVLAFSWRCRRHMTSLMSGWHHTFYAFHSLFINFRSADVAAHTYWKSCVNIN